MDLNGAETRKERADLQKVKVDQLKESGRRRDGWLQVVSSRNQN